MMANQAEWGFGSNGRFKDPDIERHKKLPGPDYTQPGSLGLQPSSTRRTEPLPGFGSSTRDHMTKMFITPEHEKVQFGKNSPVTDAPPRGPTRRDQRHSPHVLARACAHVHRSRLTTSPTANCLSCTCVHVHACVCVCVCYSCLHPTSLPVRVCARARAGTACVLVESLHRGGQAAVIDQA